ncbi:M56 family metallopeptidase [Gilvibacter sp. SZ-19]|uniref:M56 family metallopeptidase n=1 Tax=Gilvibacter sp. SZ-19 TaxID=754429 RepID=UPI0012FB45C8|nr:M56 family metallopeptidase [Gilvibacter sp. SZ-19]
MELYVLKSAACWALLYGFYKLLLERESMHQLKRWYLLGGLVLGALIPLVTFTTYITADADAATVIISAAEGTSTATGFWSTLDYVSLIWTIYWLGFAVFAVRFVWNLGKLLRRIWAHPKQSQRPLFYVLLARPVQPHTFFKYIFVNSKRFAQRAIPKEVLLHEQAHAQQLHSADVLLAEALQVVFWFNPLVYLLKHSILLNHEFLADEAVLNTGVPKSQYQNTLLAYLNPRTCPDLASAINYSSIKKRFTLMKNSSPKRVQWAKSLLLLPLLAILLYSFSTTKEVLLEEEIPLTETAETGFNYKTTEVFDTNEELRINIQGKTVYVNGTKTSLRDFKNAVNAATRNWNEDDFENSTLDLRIKNVDRDFMQKLNDAFKKTDFYKANPGRYQYGIIPPPPPPPPAPPTPVVEEVEIEVRDAQNLKYKLVEIEEVEEVEEELEEIIEVENVQTKVKRKAKLNSSDPEDEVIIIEVVETPDTSLPPPPPPPKKPIEAIKDLIAQGASFYLDGNKISADKALALVKADKINYIDVEKVDNNPPKVLMKQ